MTWQMQMTGRPGWIWTAAREPRYSAMMVADAIP
jgi:hypothetical protein